MEKWIVLRTMEIPLLRNFRREQAPPPYGDGIMGQARIPLITKYTSTTAPRIMR